MKTITLVTTIFITAMLSSQAKAQQVSTFINVQGQSITCIASESEGTGIDSESEGTGIDSESEGTGVPSASESEGTGLQLTSESEGTGIYLVCYEG